MSVVLFKTILSLFLAAAVWIALANRSRLETWLAARPRGFSGWSWVALRLLPYLGLYVVLRQPAPSDLVGFYNGASGALLGKLAYRDYVTVYAPFFSYLTALPLLLWHDPRAIIGLMVLVEGALLGWTVRRYRIGRFGVLTYLLLPASVVFCVLGGQEDVWMWGFGLGFLATYRRPFRAGLVVGLGLLVTKALFVVVIPALFFWMRDKVRFTLGMAAVGLPVLAFWYYFGGLSFLMPIDITQDPLAPNLWSVAYPFLGDWVERANPRVFNWLGLGLIILVSCLFTLRRRNDAPETWLSQLWVLAFGLVMLVLRSSYANYVFAFVLPLWVLVLARPQARTLRTVVLVLNVLAAVQPSLWWRLGLPFYRFADLTEPLRFLEYGTQLGLVVGVAYLVWWVWSQRHRANDPT
jgi:hypothetical protein